MKKLLLLILGLVGALQLYAVEDVVATVVEFLIYGSKIDPSQIQLLSVPASRPREKKQTEMQRLMDVNAMEEQMLESCGIPRGSRAGKLLVKPVSNQPQMFRLIPTGTLSGGAYQIGSADDKWYRFMIGR